MKKILLIVAALFLVAGGAMAQAHKGKKYIGTSVMLPSQMVDGAIAPISTNMTTGFNFSKVGDLKTTTVGIAPEFGYFLTDNIVLGIAAGYTHRSVKEAGTTTSTNAWGVNGYARYYWHVSDRLGVFLQPGVLYSSDKIGDNDATHVFYAGIKPGLDYKLSEKFDIVSTFGNLGYVDYGNSMNSFELNLNMTTLNIALVYVF